MNEWPPQNHPASPLRHTGHEESQEPKLINFLRYPYPLTGQNETFVSIQFIILLRKIGTSYGQFDRTDGMFVKSGLFRRSFNRPCIYNRNIIM